MFRIFFFLLLIWRYVLSYSTEDYLNDINILQENMLSYNYSERYDEFYRSSFIDGGNYGVYDFIIIGAGSAGTVLANRLSENTNWKVLLLESGQNETEITDVIGLAGLLQFSDYNWGYRSTPQNNSCLGMVEQRCILPRGKGLGGSSIINYAVYTRGNKEDYINWAEDGNPDWSHEEVLPYFLKSENSTLTGAGVDEEYHSSKGTLHVEHASYFTQMGESFLEANQELGLEVVDYNAKQQIGVSRQQLTTINGRRCSGNKAFLSKAVNRKNLKIQTGAFVLKILLKKSPKGLVANQVEFTIGDEIFRVKARKEVILSAGALNSPKILLHSGVGPKEHLEQIGIETKVDLPVGQNLGDHMIVFTHIASNYTDPNIGTMEEMIEEYLEGNGYLTIAGGEAIAFVNTSKSMNPDIEYLIFYINNTLGLQNIHGYTNETNQAIPKEHLSIATILLHPKSRGTVSLRSNDPFDHPLIDINYFSDPNDVEILVEGLKNIQNIVSTQAMQSINASISQKPFPQCPDKFWSDDYLRCLVRYVASSVYHHSGTCKMGPITDPETVVDSRLRVKGVKNLRVIDASVIPFPLAAHTNAPVFMIGEKGSDLIKEDYLFF